MLRGLNGLMAVCGLACLSAVFVLSGCDDGEKIRRTSSAELEVLGQFAFSKIEVGATQTRWVIIENVGVEAMTIAYFEAELNGDLDTAWLMGDPPVEGEMRAPEPGLPDAFDLDAGARFSIRVNYRAEAGVEPSGRILFQTNAGIEEQREMVLPISVKQASGELVGGPIFIDYGPIQIGANATRSIRSRILHTMFSSVPFSLMALSTLYSTSTATILVTISMCSRIPTMMECPDLLRVGVWN